MIRSLLGTCVALLITLQSEVPACAHPHVWATIHSEVVYDADGAMIAIRHAWTFDDMFSAFALQGLRHAKQGEYTREELSSLAKVNVTSLKEYDFFTYGHANGKKVQFGDAVDYWLEYRNSVLTLHFTLPVKGPVSAKRVQVEIYDPTIFIDFEFAKDKPVSLVGAPQQCQLVVELPHEPTPAEQLRLSQLDENPLDPSSTYGETFANKIVVKCP
jgi:ABC-type uncharacterized transport system substrate-binding protein